MSPSYELLIFGSLAALALGSAAMVVTTRNLVHAGFWLLPCLIGIAGLFAMLEAHFFVVTQVLVYIGAILILILFALMLTRDVMDPRERQHNRLVPVAAITCALSALGAAWVLYAHPWRTVAAAAGDAHAQTVQLGRALITGYALPFEMASLILLAALIGAIVVAQPERDSRRPKSEASR